MARRMLLTACVIAAVLFLLGAVFILRRCAPAPLASVTEVPPQHRSVAGVWDGVPGAPRAGMPRDPNLEQPVVLPPAPAELASMMPAPIAQWLADWTEQELAGRSAGTEQILALRKLLAEHDVSASQTAQLICLIAMLDGNSAVLPLLDFVLERATAELSLYTAPDQAAKPIVEALWPLHTVLWDGGQWARDQKLLELLRPWEVYGSGRSQWASYIYAELLYSQGKAAEAYQAFKYAAAEREAALEPSDGINRPLDYELGLMLFYVERYAEAEQHLRAAAQSHRYADLGDILAILVISLVRQDKLDDARTYVRQFREKKCFSVLQTQMMLELTARTQAQASGGNQP